MFSRDYIKIILFILLCITPFYTSEGSQRRPIIVRVLETTNSNIPHIFPEEVTKLSYNQGALIQKEIPNRYGSNVGFPGQTITILTEGLERTSAQQSLKESLGRKTRDPLPLKAKIEVNKWEMVITFTYIFPDEHIESRTIRFDNGRAGDFLIKFSNKSFAVFCGYGDGL
jgi:hypothetical protein